MNTDTVLNSLLYFDFDKIIKKKIYIWGAWERGYAIEKVLDKMGIMIEGYIDSSKKDKEFYKKKVYLPSILIGNEKEYFIFVSLVEHNSVRQTLKENGYIENINYIYLGKYITLMSCHNYIDIYGNTIVGNVEHIIVKFALGSKLIIGENITFGKDVYIEIAAFSKVVIGDNSNILDGVSIIATDFSEITIGNSAKINKNTQLWAKYQGKIVIGEKSTFGTSLSIKCQNRSQFICGIDCMFSYNIKVRGNDGHTIIDQKKETIYERKRDVIVGNHVWCGMGGVMIPGTNIGSNSIVGAGTITNKVYPANSIIAGCPGKVLREDVTWCREENLTYEQYEEKYLL